MGLHRAGARKLSTSIPPSKQENDMKQGSLNGTHFGGGIKLDAIFFGNFDGFPENSSALFGLAIYI